MLIIAAWWPRGTFWLSDDWLAIHYASDFGRALSDFTGNQYSLPGVVWFYRPLVTLGLAVDTAIAGAVPFVSHLSNALAQGIGALLVGLLGARFAGAAAGWWAALLWGLAPLHAGSVLWAVGRVDAHAVPWILGSAWLLVRWSDGAQRTRAPALLCFAAALLTKELAVVVPVLALLLCAGLAAPGQRLRSAAAGAWPFFVMLAAYLGWRWLLFGRVIGGYSGEALEPAALARGLGQWTLRALDPLLTLGADGLAPTGLGEEWLRWRWVGLAPAAAAAALLVLRRRLGLLLLLAAAWVCCAAPALQFWAHTENLPNARYFTLAYAALALLLASGGPWTALPALLVCALPHLEVRNDWIRAFAQARAMHARIAELAGDLRPGPLFVHGLPRVNAKGDVVMFHNGVDRLLVPPFGPGVHQVRALRPLSPRADAPLLPYGEVKGLPHGQTLSLLDSQGVFLLEPDQRPRMDACVDGLADGARITPQLLTEIHAGTATPAFRAAVSAPQLRITIFTAGGYLTCVLPNEATDGREARVAFASWLRAPTTPREHVVTDLVVPVAMDLEPRFPVLVEAGQGPAGMPHAFVATHVARELLWLGFDPAYCEFIGGASR